MDIIDQDHNTGAVAGLKPPYSIERSYSEAFHGTGAQIDGVLYSFASGQLGVIVITSGEAPSLVEQIQDEVMQTFDINMSELAEVCRVSRKTPYNWRDDDKTINRRKKGMDRLFTLSIAAKNWRNAGYPTPGNLLREPAVNGKSLYDLLTAEDLDKEAIQFLGARLAMRQLGSAELGKPFG